MCFAQDGSLYDIRLLPPANATYTCACRRITSANFAMVEISYNVCYCFSVVLNK